MIPNSVMKVFYPHLASRFNHALLPKPTIYQRIYKFGNQLQLQQPQGLKVLSSVKAPEFNVTYCSEGKILKNDFESLLSGKKQALVVEGFLRGELLENNQRISSGYNPSIAELPLEFSYFGFKREEFLHPADKQAYYDKTAEKSLEAYREMATPYTTWIDQLMGQLNIAYRPGALYMRQEGKMQTAFITRGYSSQCVQDVALRAMPSSIKLNGFSSFFSCKLFLVQPSVKGSISLYNPMSAADCANYDKKLEQGKILPKVMPKEIDSIKIFAGRLLIHNAMFPYKMHVEDTIIEGKQEKDKGSILAVKKKIPFVLGETYLLHQPGEPLRVLR